MNKEKNIEYLRKEYNDGKYFNLYEEIKSIEEAITYIHYLEDEVISLKNTILELGE